MRSREEISAANVYKIIHTSFVGQQIRESEIEASHLPPLHLEVLLDIRDLLQELKDKEV